MPQKLCVFSKENCIYSINYQCSRYEHQYGSTQSFNIMNIIFQKSQIIVTNTYISTPFIKCIAFSGKQTASIISKSLEAIILGTTFNEILAG
ncbi:hypothetical protein HERIO_329 [Hepatospora eriocheir]|uniref:Uncharacterized protein n=1 Tax=Hepatospora eriocheir TaxID=1081669 RepID=A0A1X0QDQ9_9MICR|nr:hypothetical protein HERIO_329 [Hepatospora eriocheir]